MLSTYLIPAIISAIFLESTLACPQHGYNIRATDIDLRKRSDAVDWTYETAKTWGWIKDAYNTCQTGSTQSPISLPRDLSTTHRPTFAWSQNPTINGHLFNSGHGPSFTINQTDITKNPSFTYDNNKTAYLASWHTHTPSEHLLKDTHTHGEIHLVHTTSTGALLGVIGIPLVPSNTTSNTFFSQFLSQTPALNSSTQVQIQNLDMRPLLASVDNFSSYYTYKGSLTTPPCTEGLRWWVSATPLKLTYDQLAALLAVSEYSARPTQLVWGHDIGV